VGRTGSTGSPPPERDLWGVARSKEVRYAPCEGGASVPRRMQQGGLAVNIGRPKRIIEIEPVTVPLPEPQMPMPEPGPAPVEPMPVELPVEPPGP